MNVSAWYPFWSVVLYGGSFFEIIALLVFVIVNVKFPEKNINKRFMNLRALLVI